MIVLCHHASLRPKTQAALERYTANHVLVMEESAGDDRSYFRTIAKYWNTGPDLLIVEHDIEIHADVIPQLETCGGDWCTFPYRLWKPDVWIHNALGCTRF